MDEPLNPSLNPLPVGPFSRPGVILVGALVFLNLYDVVYHLITEQSLSLHQLSEAVMVTSITAFAIFLLLRHRRTLGRAGEQMERIRAEADEARREAQKTADELRRYRQENRDAFESLRRAMSDQFARWRFSPEEQRAARLIIQGLSFREIAARLNKSEKTIRNQSLSIYEKSGMTGRNDLAAFFLLDILDIDE
ncbi:MAG: LuxR family transcriptional regulator [Spirochaetae bacterium HGW-Spirochaetae-10]|nr:MAG: LuxR family transcriptional regulator [Spirochaetae bacterium HGW-Spirochaetae-10]